LTATYTRVAPYGSENPKVARLNSLLVQLVCREGLPLRLVETESFKAFIRELDPRYNLPTRQSLSQVLIPTKYDETKAQLQESIDQAQSVSITTDMWTSSANEAYMGITGHWMDNDFCLNSRCLAVRPAPGSHTADFIAAELTSMAAEWKLNLSTLRAVTDNGANVKKAVSHLAVEKWRGCFDHTLQLCVNGALTHRSVTELPKILQKARTIVGHFRRSPTASEELLKAQKQLNMPQHKLLQDCPTRWNSQVRYVLFTLYING